VLAKISTDLAWRGPNGSSARYVVLERDAAEALLDPIDERALLSEIFRLVGLLNDAMPECERAPPPQSTGEENASSSAPMGAAGRG
jgi:hypothetical protein